jgi:hypothetical protein
MQQRLITLENLTTRLASRHGRPGSVALRQLVAGVASGARSVAERRVVSAVTTAGITGWVAGYEVRDASGLIAVVDLAFPQSRLAVEIDGLAWHVTADRFQRDRTRQNRLVNAGWTVLRFTWEDVADRPEEVVASIRAALTRLAS